MDVEIIVVDNFSSDPTPGIASRLADRFLTGGPERSAQRNMGAAIATGDILVFLDSDMRAPVNLAHDVVDTLDRLPAVDALILPEISVGEGYWARCKALEKTIYLGDSDVEAARVFRSRAFWAVGGFDEELFAGEDWDLSDRLEESGCSFGRTAATITHDEGSLTLIADLRKKFYYGRSLHSYFRKRPRQVGPRLIRSGFLRKGGVLLKEPGLAAGLVSMKILELGAVAAGAAASIVPAGLRAFLIIMRKRRNSS